MSRWQRESLPLRQRSLPRANRVDLWLTDLEELPLEAGPSGLTRQERVLKRRIQQRFVLHLLLGSYLGVPGKSVRLSRDDQKPRLVGALAESGLSFNVSHSDRWLGIAVACGREVGLDIERPRTLGRAGDLALRYFKGSDCQQIVALDEPDRSARFLEQWTAREALIKAMGLGLAGQLGLIELACRPPAIERLPEGWPEQWQLLQPEWPQSLIGHLASPGEEIELACHWLKPDGRG